MKIFNTASLNEASLKTMNPDEASWIYNGLDCCVTADVYKELKNQLDSEPENVQETHRTALNKLAPIMEMTLRGTKISADAKNKTLRELEELLRVTDLKFQKLMRGVFDTEMNWRSPLQLKNLFYGSLRLKEIKKRNAKGQFMPTVNREALESFNSYVYARPFANFILILRDLHKQISFLKTELDPDGRIRTNYNIAGTNTGRLASSMSDFGTGTNLQNVNRKLRFPFVADPGYYMLNIDLEQADGRNVGAICRKIFTNMPRERIARYMGVDEWIGPIGEEFAGSYLRACESGDLHTTVANMVWPELDWPDDPAAWKKFCDGIIAHGQDSYRQLAKKGGHGTNYYGTPRTMAKHLHSSTKVIAAFQDKYFGAFPVITAWHNWVIEQIKETGTITTLFGRRRMFFGRPNDASTHRKAIAFEPQSCTGEQIDRGMLAVWRKYPQVQLLNQVHDSILLQVPFSEVSELAPGILKTLEVELEIHGHKFSVPLDAAGGWNWGYHNEKTGENPYGLEKWRGKETRVAPLEQRGKSFRSLL